jgi:hypothetical protein
MKSFFNIGLVEIESNIVSKIVFVTTFFGHRSVLSPYCTMGSERKTNLIFLEKAKKQFGKN